MKYNVQLSENEIKEIGRQRWTGKHIKILILGILIELFFAVIMIELLHDHGIIPNIILFTIVFPILVIPPLLYAWKANKAGAKFFNEIKYEVRYNEGN